MVAEKKTRKTYTVKSSQIRNRARGWLTIELSDGSVVKARPRDVRVIGGLEQRRVGDRIHNCTKYVRRVGNRPNLSATGNTTMDNGDSLARKLRGADLETVYKQASQILGIPQTELRGRYAHLNVGMQRMNLGNRMRAAME